MAFIHLILFFFHYITFTDAEHCTHRSTKTKTNNSIIYRIEQKNNRRRKQIIHYVNAVHDKTTKETQQIIKKRNYVPNLGYNHQNGNDHASAIELR